MALINQINASNEDDHAYWLSSWAATICLMIGMIISIVGIKIWWFKHRLTFEQSNANSGAPGGSQPMLRNNTRDKRQSQQVCDSVVVHGVFRQRREDELEVVERPSQLPPIRLPKLSQSSSASMLPPPRTRRSNTTPNIPFSMTGTPTQEPTTPVVEETIVIQADNMPVTPPLAENVAESNLESFQFKKVDIKKDIRDEPVSVDEISMTPKVLEIITNEIEETESTHSEPQFRFEKAKRPLKMKESEKYTTERRATGFLVPDEAYELTTAVGTVDDEMAGLKEKFVANDVNGRSSTNPTVLDFEAVLESTDAQNWQDEEQESKGQDIELEKSTNNFEYEGKQTPPMTSSNYVEKAWEIDPNKASQEIRTFNIDLQHYPINAECNNNATAFGRFNEDTDDDDETDELHKQHYQQGNQMWHKENAEFVNTDFKQHIENEFEKIRHNYQEHEGHFLELNELQNETVQPKGYGKSIDEDWENFNDLKLAEHDVAAQEENLQEYTKTVKTLSTKSSSRTTTTMKTHTVHFELLEDEETDRAVSLERSHNKNNVDYVSSIEELFDELSDKEEILDNHTWKHEALSTQNEAPIKKASILKESLHVFANMSPTPKARKLKSQQKVTFDVNTEEYYLPESDSESDEETDERFYSNRYNDEHFTEATPPPLPKTAAPVPMQRMTKTHYNAAIPTNEEDDNFQEWLHTKNQIMYTSSLEEQQQYSEEIQIEQHRKQEQQLQQQQTAALLFSTQISLDDTDYEAEVTGATNDQNDSWSAIRQRRYKNDELDELSPATNPYEAPMPAYRNPLAQAASNESNMTMKPFQVPAPRMLHDMKQPQSRKYARQSSLEEYGRSVTEA